MKTSEQLDQLATALATAQGKLESVQKDNKANGEKFSYKYADLGSAIQTAKSVLAESGLSVSQLITNGQNGRVAVNTILMHKSGQFISSLYEAPQNFSEEMRMNDMQAEGSAITYMRRYSYLAILGMSTEDDDAASTAPKAEKKFEFVALGPKCYEHRSTLAKHGFQWMKEEKVWYARSHKDTADQFPVLDGVVYELIPAVTEDNKM